MKKVNTLKRLVSIFVTIALSLPVAANSATQSSYPTKAAPVAGDKALITDSADGNKTKQATVGSMPISTATQSALDGKANASAFASQEAFTAAWGWTPEGGAFDQSGDYTLTGNWNFSGATVTGLSGGSMIYPSAGIPASTGSAWGTSYSVGTSANNLVQLNSSAQLPAVSAALLTNFPTLNQNTTGSAARLTTARTIGGVSFDGSANINLPGVNAAGNQSTTGNAATATTLQTARTIGGVSFNGSANINLPGVNTAGNQSTTGNAGTATALAANGINCSTGQAALGVDASGNAEGCWTPPGSFDPSSPGAIGGTTPAAGTFTTVTAANYTSSAADGSRRSILPSNTTMVPSGGGIVEIYNEGGAIKAVEANTEYDVLLSRDIGTSVQAYDADLAALAVPTAWRLYYSNGSSAQTELAFGALNTFMVSGGASAAPSFYDMTTSINAGAPNGSSAKVHWSQLTGVPAGFADGSDDGTGGGITHATSDGTYYASRNGAWSAFTSGNYTLAMTLTGNTAITLPTAGTLVVSGDNIGAATATTPSVNDNDTSVATTAYVQAELTAYASDTATLTNKSVTAVEVDGSASGTLTAAQVSGTIVTNRGQAASDVALTMPTAAAGYNALFTVGTAQTNKWGVRAGTNDKIYLLAADGTISAGSDNGYARMTNAQVGQAFACWTFQTGSSTWDWQCKASAIGTSTFAAN